MPLSSARRNADYTTGAHRHASPTTGDSSPPPPLVVTAVARAARAIAGGQSGVTATARARTATGRWAVVRGSVLLDGTRLATAVTLHEARTPELAALIADAYGLTARERRVTELVAQGLSTAEEVGSRPLVKSQRLGDLRSCHRVAAQHGDQLKLDCG
jgi:hypothetical protein